MITIEKTTHHKLIKDLTTYDTYTSSRYFLIKSDDFIVGIFELQAITKITETVHLYILPAFQKKGIAYSAFLELIEYLKQEQKILKLICTIPITNKNILSALRKTPFKACGVISHGIIWNEQIQDLLIFELTILR